MKTLIIVARRKPGEIKWRYAMDYKQACRKYKQENEDLKFLQMRLATATMQEYEKVTRNIKSKRQSIKMLEKWFKFTGNKIPKIT